ncbi:hypothetical protein I588_00106 [Enterococcus pallens ATCC BAA-351]|uniref:Uncharacterized protein n=1 Tax=Enterococcus pallens ATCC BAA-351 TaxID=1158607 RepID=R2SFW0_9ENTE|nr:hypothetical protein UAU_01975 [Enterococcus pallens ATCC BAA-351]EOU24119.1 hypothetical protein I588_00106 [Enterococcus pallens ATCC BAA-351]
MPQITNGSIKLERILYRIIFIFALITLALRLLYYFAFQDKFLDFNTCTGIVLLVYSYDNIFIKNKS